jgi:hypothetical protein
MTSQPPLYLDAGPLTGEGYDAARRLSVTAASSANFRRTGFTRKVMNDVESFFELQQKLHYGHNVRRC